jgi:hypothetical protein
MTEKELIDKITELSTDKEKGNKVPIFVTLKELSLIFEIQALRKTLASSVNKGFLLEGDTINDKYYLISKE